MEGGSKEYFHQGKKVDAILVDEAQFLSGNEIDILSDIVDFYDIPVTVLWTTDRFPMSDVSGLQKAYGDI
ncbi:hypothetical protein [Mediterraneibacter faecis]|uniref:hypothetical protein n=1 Tax=Mediterraneibacter faecis TaxID=592978 RepID=UPI0022DEC4C2|nr:hypothetical protein [Mediterraneibacter faecis]